MSTFSAGGALLPYQGAQISAPELHTQTKTGSLYGFSIHEDLLESQIVLSPTSGTVSAPNGLNAFRGEVVLSPGQTFGTSAPSFLTGVYGRGNIYGTVDIGSGDLAAVYAKFDCKGSTLTSGHIAPLQSNIVNPPASSSNLDLIYAESASGTSINSILKAFAAATYFCDLTDVGATYIVAAAVGGSQNKKLKCNIGGTTYYIPLNTA